MAARALIVYGGWDGHQPREVAGVLARVLNEDGFEVESFDSLAPLGDADRLARTNLLVPVWTMGELPENSGATVCAAVAAGLGVAGCHGGMCDAFRNNTDWQFLTGGQWVAHPGNDGTRYTVRVTDRQHPIMREIDDFEVRSEQYYMHVDPAVRVLATTRFPVADGPHAPNGPVDMPVVWTKLYGKGRVFYCSLGHQADIVAGEPCLTILRRGFGWAVRA
jgi:type 1 glutamine amidotransferase